MQPYGKTRLRRGFLCLMAVGLLLGIPLLPAGLLGQSSNVTETHRRVLEVRQKQVELRASRADFERALRLRGEGLISQAELEQVRSQLETAQLAYQESVLSLLSLQPRLSIRNAVKYQDSGGRKFVRLTVTNLTPTFDDAQFEMLNNFEGAEPIPDELRTRDIRDIFISLRDSGSGEVPRGTTIGLPYEQHIPQLKYGKSETIVFQILRDVSHLVVAASYLGQEREIDIQLEQEESGTAVTVSSTQLSQEGDLGTPVTYSLRLQRTTVDVRSFQLLALNLPRQIAHSFIEPETEARLSLLNFPAGVTEQRLELRLFLPEQPGEEIVVDQPLEFVAVVIDPASRPGLTAEQPHSIEELEQSGAGSLRLEVVPRGIGKIEVTALSLFSEIPVGESVLTKINIRNTGTRRLDSVRLLGEAPMGWTVTFNPDSLGSLELGRETSVDLQIVPAQDVAVGDYEVRLRTQSYAYNRQVPSEDKIYRISVKPQSNLLVTLSLVGVLLALLSGAVAMAIKLTRR